MLCKKSPERVRYASSMIFSEEVEGLGEVEDQSVMVVMMLEEPLNASNSTIKVCAESMGVGDTRVCIPLCKRGHDFG